MDNTDDPKIYNIMSCLLVFVSFYIFYKVCTLNEDDYYDSETDDENNHSN